MTPVQMGWYEDPHDPTHQMFWAGSEWTTLRRRTPAAEAPVERELASPLDLGPPRDHMAEARAKVAAGQERAKIKAREQPTICLSDGCDNPRIDGFYHCVEHNQRLIAAGHTPIAVPVQAVPSGNAALICPHCQVRGRIQTRTVRQKKGVSGAKATGAVLTGGLSLLGTGLSRKEKATEMWCRNCNTKWYV